MNTKKLLCILLLCIFIIFCLSFMFQKGFFVDSKSFIRLAENKIIRIYHNMTNKTPQIQEEIITTAEGKKVLLDHPKGYSLNFPAHMNFDLSASPMQIKIYDDETTIIVTREWAPYEDVIWYIENYLNNYYLDDKYIETNNITILENETYKVDGADARFISLKRTPPAQSTVTQNHYSYFFITSSTGKQAFFRIMFKTKNPEKNLPMIKEIISTFKEIQIKGENVYKNEYSPAIPNGWNKETKDFYQNLIKSKKIKWGIFVDGSYGNPKKYQWITDMEKKLNYEFDFALHYVNLQHGFPVEELTDVYNKGKMTQLTLQISNHANDDLFGKNLNFDVYDSLLDEEIRAFARGAKEYSHPFLFRLNNEMNSDWVNYSGVAALSDPEIFIENWRRIYTIFSEEGVDNAIWIFNPNAEECPPCHWNSFICYYPGDSYVQMIGLTGYNTGTYYKNLYHEKWRTFDEIYKEPYEKYLELFHEFPFIITEFASSSIGGDKAAWITDMFQSIQTYENIKMALWWSSADYDMRAETYKHLARPYFLDETEETTNAFKEGLKKYFAK